MSAPAGPVELDAATSQAPLDSASAVVTAAPLTVSYVPVQTRSERFTSTVPGDFPAVTGREIEWKFSPVERLRPLIDGDLDGSRLPFTTADVAGVEVAWVSRHDVPLGTAGVPEDRASANAWSSFGEALSIVISAVSDESELPRTVTLRRDDLGSHARSAHTIIEAKPNTTATVLLENSGAALLAENVEILVGDDATLTVVTVQQWNDDAIHLASHFARVGRNARLHHIVISLDGAIIRINPSVHLSSEGGDAELDGAYFSTAGQHIEQQVFVDHDAARTKSRVTYKGALQGAKARSVWIGDVLIRQSGTSTDSYEQNRNLLLTDGARADSVPNLEIETGDILGAGHASASGRFDDEQLFYLQARGITEDEARRLVVKGFLSEIIQKIGSPELQARLETAIDSTLVPQRGAN